MHISRASPHTSDGLQSVPELPKGGGPGQGRDPGAAVGVHHTRVTIRALLARDRVNLPEHFYLEQNIRIPIGNKHSWELVNEFVLILWTWDASRVINLTS